MRIYILCLLLLLTSFSLVAQKKNNYKIYGTISGLSLDDSVVYLRTEGLPITEPRICVDSVKVKNGKFVFKGKMKGKPDLYSIKVSGYRRSTNIVIEPGEIRVDFSASGINISGTPMNEDLKKYILKPSGEVAWATQDKIEKKKEKMAKGEWTYDHEKEYKASMPSELLEGAFGDKIYFIHKYTGYPVVRTFIFPLLTTRHKSLDYIYPGLSREVKEKLDREKTEWDRLYAEFVKNKKLPQIKEVIPENALAGNPYIDFKGKTSGGDTIVFSETAKNKRLILLDFWASWCGPCMQEMPGIIEIYNTYHSKGLEIIGISLDKNDLSWKKAIEKNQMKWIQLRDSGEDESDCISKLYGVAAIPYTILIDQDGKIIGRRLRGEELRKKIGSLLK